MQSINSIRPVTLSSSRFSGHRCKHTSLKRKSTRSIRYLRSAFIPAPRLLLLLLVVLFVVPTKGAIEGGGEREDGSCSGETVHVQSIPSKKFRSRRGGHYSCKALTTSTSSSICVSTRMGIYVAVIRVVTANQLELPPIIVGWNIRLWGKLSYHFGRIFLQLSSQN